MMIRKAALTLCILFLNTIQVDGVSSNYIADGCHMLNNCNDKGSCNTDTKTCTCITGWGAPTDIAEYKAPDCSLATCPAGNAWADIPTTTTAAHALKECSGAGKCNRVTGACECFEGYTGSACDRTTCPNDCSGHGRCLSMRQLATMTSALPLSAATTYAGSESTTNWDKDRIYGCLCDSSWSVGLASGETQVPEWFGADCSRRHCPSANDPLTTADETDCEGVAAYGGYGTGAAGNLCHHECGGRGTCNYKTGLCTCYDGFYGTDCTSQSPLSWLY